MLAYEGPLRLLVVVAWADLKTSIKVSFFYLFNLLGIEFVSEMVTIVNEYYAYKQL